MKLTVFVVFLIALLAVPAFAYDWVVSPINGHSYALTNTPTLQPTWVEAEAEAVSLGGHLATIRSLAEEQWLKNLYGTDWLWIGLNDITSEGTFNWISGEAVSYTNWNGGEPNNQNDEDFVGMNIGDTREWNDFPDWYRLYGIIEVAPVPESSSILGLITGIATLTTLKRRKGR